MKFVLYVALILFLVPDKYIYKTFLRELPLIWRILFILPTALGLVSVILLLLNVFSNVITTVFVVSLFCFTLPKLVFLLFSMFARLFGKRNRKAYTIFCRLGFVVACAVSLVALYGVTFAWKQLDTEYVDLYFDDLPEAFDGYTIAHLSDLHLGSYGNRTAFVEKVVRRVNEEHPDLIVFTGDIVNTEPEELSPFVPVLSKLSASDGIISVFGNHDYCAKGNQETWTTPQDGGRMVAEMERSMGWKVLLNESVELNKGDDRIAVAGLEYLGKDIFLQNCNIKAALEGITDYDTIKCDDDKFTILLSHTPSQWALEILPNTHIPLTLSGHIHASQIKIGKWSPASLFYKEWGGLYQSGNQQLYVSEGVGGMLPFRLGCRPQVTLLTLHCKKSVFS